MDSNLSVRELFKEIRCDRIEVKEMKDVVIKFLSGDGKINKAREIDGNFPAIVRRDIFDSEGFIENCKMYVNENSIKTKTYIEKGAILVANDGYTKENTKGFSIFLGNFVALAGNGVHVLEHNQNPKYLNSALSSIFFESQIKPFLKEGLSSMMRIDLKDIKKIKIPIPSRELQEKIGDFLFKFAEYEKKLQQELEHRRKQFNHYKELVFE